MSTTWHEAWTARQRLRVGANRQSPFLQLLTTCLVAISSTTAPTPGENYDPAVNREKFLNRREERDQHQHQHQVQDEHVFDIRDNQLQGQLRMLRLAVPTSEVGCLQDKILPQNVIRDYRSFLVTALISACLSVVLPVIRLATTLAHGKAAARKMRGQSEFF